MRLLYFDGSKNLRSKVFDHNHIPPYAILSHTWGDEEFLFEDLVNNTGKNKAGYAKILFCGEQAERDHIDACNTKTECDCVQYFWVDTCCIDKWKLRELSIAINSMFEWYQNAAKCYTFLPDVSAPMTDAKLHQDTWEASFRNSRWFTRGWTLQELLAPRSMDFFSAESKHLGDRNSLKQIIHEITRIPIAALSNEPLNNFSVDEKIAWMVGRQTTEEEDMAYSLIGILGVSMESRYGEKKEKALKRLQGQITKANTPTAFVIPFAENAQFIGRESQLAELGTLIAEDSAVKVAITGPSGIGKTHLALKLAYRIGREYEDFSVFWMSASNMEDLYKSYAHIAQQLAIPGWDDDKANMKQLVQSYLSKESAGQWLLILDDADEAMLETNRASKAVTLIDHLPSSSQGAIVFTTSDRKVAAELASRIIELPALEEELAQKLLENYLVKPTNNQEKGDLLVKELAYFPLAIMLAAAYINVNMVTLEQYVAVLAKKKSEVVELSGIESDKIIATVWLISFEQICRHNTLAADYLTFMASIDKSDIPLALLPLCSPREIGIHAINILEAYSFVSKRTAESSLDLHRLVHVSTRNWLSKKGLSSQQTQVAITRLLEVFPDRNNGNRSKWRRLLPHISSLISNDLEGQDPKSRIDLIEKFAWALHSDGRLDEAEVYWKIAIQSQKKVLGEEHQDTLTTTGNLALTIWTQGRGKEAEELTIQVMETMKRVLGREHAETLNVIGNLAIVYHDQGRWKEAEELEVEVLRTKKRVLGEDHIETLKTMGNLAATVLLQGRWEEAEELELEVLRSKRRVLGDEHLDTISSMNNLAETYRILGRWKEAEELDNQVIGTRNRVLGEEHPDTLKAMANLAITYENQGRLKEAEELAVQVSEARDRVLGGEHPDTLTSRNNLSSIFLSQGRWAEAEKLQLQVMETRKRVLGEEHQETLTSMNNLSETNRKQGRWKEAEELKVQVIEIMKRVLGEEHPSTLTAMGNLALSYHDQGRLKEAEELGIQVMEMRKRVLREDHPDTLLSMANLALIFSSAERLTEAEALGLQVLAARKRVLGEEHPETLTSINNLVATYSEQGRYKEAEELQGQVVEMMGRVLGEGHPSTLAGKSNLANTYRNQGRWEEAEMLEVQVIDLEKRLLGKEHPSTLMTMANLVLTYSSQGRWNEAEELGGYIMETRKLVLGEEHPDTLMTMANLAVAFSENGRRNEAVELYVQIVEVRKRTLGEEHPDTLVAMANLASSFSSQGHWSKAEALQLRVLEVRKRVLGEEHHSTLISMGKLVPTLWNLGRVEEAEQWCVQVIEAFQRGFGKKHSNTLTIMSNLASIYKYQGRAHAAEKLDRKVMELRME